MNKTIPFTNHPEIGENIFNYLDLQDLLNCQLVCHDWKNVLENPYFWLKKLRKVGHPSQIDAAWKKLIFKSPEFGLPKNEFTKCLQMKFKAFMEGRNLGKRPTSKSKFHFKCPPIFTAAYFGSVEIVKLIYQLGEHCNPRFGCRNFGQNYYEMPIFVAIKNGHTEVAKFIADTPQELKCQSVEYYSRHIPMSLAIWKRNFELVKFLVPRTPNLNYINERTLLHWALRDYKIFKLLISQPSVNPDIPDIFGQIPLQLLCDIEKDLSPEHVTEMVKILVSKSNMNYLIGHVHPLRHAAEKGAMVALKALCEFFDPNVQDEKGDLPIDRAIFWNQIDAIKFLAPLTKELKIPEKYKNRSKKYALKIMQSLIDERNSEDSHPIVHSCDPPCKKIKVESDS